MIIYKLTTTDIGATQTASKFNDGIQLLSFPFDPANTDYDQFKKAVLDGAALQDAEGVTMSAEQATQFVKELP